MTRRCADIAVVGVGRWGSKLARNLHGLGRLAVVVDTSPAALDALSRALPSVRLATDLSRVLDDPDVRGVVIATPPSTHAELGQAVLRAGRDLFVEKPLADELDAARQLDAAARAAGRVLMVGHVLLHHPAVTRLRALLAEGVIGELRTIHAGRRGPDRSPGEHDVLAALATHDISLLLHLTGRSPIEVQATTEDVGAIGGADLARATLRWADGLVAHLDASWVHPIKERRMVLVGQTGTLVFDDLAPCPLTLCRGEDDRVAMDVAPTEPLRLECEAFVAAMDDRHAPLANGAEGVRVLEVVDALRRSAANRGRPVAPRSE